MTFPNAGLPLNGLAHGFARVGEAGVLRGDRLEDLFLGRKILLDEAHGLTMLTQLLLEKLLQKKQKTKRIISKENITLNIETNRNIPG